MTPRAPPRVSETPGPPCPFRPTLRVTGNLITFQKERETRQSFSQLPRKREVASTKEKKRRVSTRHHLPSESNMMIRRSSGPRNRRRTAPTTPGQHLGICRYRTRAHESAAPPHVTSTCGCNGTDTPTLRILDPTSTPAAPPNSARSRPTTTRRRRCASSSSAPSAPASRRSSRYAS